MPPATLGGWTPHDHPSPSRLHWSGDTWGSPEATPQASSIFKCCKQCTESIPEAPGAPNNVQNPYQKGQVLQIISRIFSETQTGVYYDRQTGNPQCPSRAWQSSLSSQMLHNPVSMEANLGITGEKLSCSTPVCHTRPQSVVLHS